MANITPRDKKVTHREIMSFLTQCVLLPFLSHVFGMEFSFLFEGVFNSYVMLWVNVLCSIQVLF